MKLSPGEFRKRIAIALVIVFASMGIWLAGQSSRTQAKISEFGKYQGYSKAVYDGSQRTSAYLTLSDGTQLAYDVIIPARKGVADDTPLPTLFKYTPYGRAWTVFDKDGNLLIGDFVDWPTQMMLRIRRLMVGDKGGILDP